MAKGAASRAQRADPRRPRPARPAPARATLSIRSAYAPAPAASPCRRSSRRRASSTTSRCAAFNEMWFRKAPRAPGRRRCRRSPRTSTRSTWSARGTACTAATGFVQYQFVVPFGAGGRAAARGRATRRLGDGQLPRRAEALRRGQPGAAQLSRARVDAGARHPGGARTGWRQLLHGLDDLVLDAGGRHYLAKDAHTTPDSDPARVPAARRVAGRRATASIRRRVWTSDLAPATRLLDRLNARRRLMDNALGEPQTIVLLGGTQRHRPGHRRRLHRHRRRAPSCSPAGGPRRAAAR